MQMLLSTLGCDANAKLVCGANVDVMLTLMLVSCTPLVEKQVMHAHGKVEKCNATSSGQSSQTI